MALQSDSTFVRIPFAVRGTPCDDARWRDDGANLPGRARVNATGRDVRVVGEDGAVRVE